MSVLLGAPLVTRVIADETAPAKPAAAVVQVSPPGSHGAPAKGPAAPTAAMMAAPIANVVGVAPGSAGRQTARDVTADVRPRLEISEATIEQHRGLVGFVVERRARPSDLLQLFNPFAPASYGNASASYSEISTTARDGTGPVRAAVSDYGPWKPSGLFFSTRW